MENSRKSQEETETQVEKKIETLFLMSLFLFLGSKQKGRKGEGRDLKGAQKSM